MEQVKLFAQLAVVACLRLLQALEVLLEVAFLGEGHAVDAGELLLGLVPFPVGPGYGHDLGRLDMPRVGNVRASTEVGEVALGVKGDGAFFKAFEQVQLVLVSFLLEVLDRIGLGHFLADEGVFGLGQLHHLLLHCRNVGIGKIVLPKIHVVVEPIFHRRPHPKLDARVKRLERLSHQVGRAVPQRGHALVVTRREKLEG